MDALHDKSGKVIAWLERSTGDILDLTGRYVAFVEDDSVYDYRGGAHLGWWSNDHIRDGYGYVTTFTKNASSLGVYKPYLAYEPYQPYKSYRPYRPFKSFKPFRPSFINSWSTTAFFT